MTKYSYSPTQSLRFLVWLLEPRWKTWSVRSWSAWGRRRGKRCWSSWRQAIHPLSPGEKLGKTEENLGEDLGKVEGCGAWFFGLFRSKSGTSGLQSMWRMTTARHGREIELGSETTRNYIIGWQLICGLMWWFAVVHRIWERFRVMSSHAMPQCQGKSDELKGCRHGLQGIYPRCFCLGLSW